MHMQAQLLHTCTDHLSCIADNAIIIIYLFTLPFLVSNSMSPSPTPGNVMIVFNLIRAFVMQYL